MNLLVRKKYIKKAQDSLVGYSYDILANKVLYDEQKQNDLLKEFKTRAKVLGFINVLEEKGNSVKRVIQ